LFSTKFESRRILTLTLRAVGIACGKWIDVSDQLLAQLPCALPCFNQGKVRKGQSRIATFAVETISAHPELCQRIAALSPETGLLAAGVKGRSRTYAVQSADFSRSVKSSANNHEQPESCKWRSRRKFRTLKNRLKYWDF
jgi:hypothetical protein